MFVFYCFKMARASSNLHIFSTTAPSNVFSSSMEFYAYHLVLMIICGPFPNRKDWKWMFGSWIIFLFLRIPKEARGGSAGPARHCCVAPPFFFYGPLEKYTYLCRALTVPPYIFQKEKGLFSFYGHTSTKRKKKKLISVFWASLSVSISALFVPFLATGRQEAHSEQGNSAISL